MRLLLVDSFETPLPPPGPGNLERMCSGLLRGVEEVAILSVRNGPPTGLPCSLYRPGSLKAARDFASSFDAAVLPWGRDWVIADQRLSFPDCLGELQRACRTATLGGQAPEIPALSRSTLEPGIVVRHCTDLQRRAVPKDAHSAVMLGCVSERTVRAAAEACRRLGLRLTVLGRHGLRFVFGAEALGEVSEEAKALILSQAAVCLVLDDGRRPVGSSSLLEPGACGTPTAAVELPHRSAISEYLFDGMTGSVFVSPDSSLERLTAAACEALEAARRLSVLDVERTTLEVYSCSAFGRAVISALTDGSGPYD